MTLIAPGVWRKCLIGLASLLTILSIEFITPNSKRHEAMLLGALAAVVAVCVGMMVHQHSKRMLRMVRVARREHALFKAAAECSLQAFYICKPVCDVFRRVVDFRLVYVNGGAEKLFGKARRELKGRRISSFLSKSSRAEVMAVWERVLSSGVAEDCTLATCRPGGNAAGGVPELYRTHVVALHGSVAVSTLQTLEEHAAENRIQELNDFAQSIIESAPVSMIATDASGTIIAMNSAAEQLTLYRKHDLIAQHSLLLLHDSTELSARAVQLSKDLDEPIAAGFQSLVAKPGKGEPEEREWTYVRSDGTRVWVNLTMATLRTSDERTTGYLGIAFDVTERKRLTDSVVHMAHHDQLTGLPNRVLLNDRLSQGVARVHRSGGKMAVFMVDVDHFKRINDSLGHMGGDELLVFVGKQLQSAVRRTDTVARVGGDEFVVFMPDFRDVADAERCAELMLHKISTPFMLRDREVRVTASIGLCLYPDGAKTGPELVRGADIAMYEAKAEGRSCFRIFSNAMVREAADKLEMEEDLRHALEQNEFSLHYQPLVRCSTGEVTGMEMLLRWKSARRGNVSPAEFIPIAEEAGLMVRIGEWALGKACADCMEVQRALGTPLKVAVNLSPRQFSQRNLIDVVQGALKESGLPADQLEIEITEQMLMVNTPCVLETLRQIRKLGVSVAIDDFGTGFSSLSYIMQYNVDRLKIDQSFVSKSTTEAGAAAIVRTIIAMAHGLNIEVVAEGVETVAQWDFLQRRRCDVAQGYLFSKAVPIGEFAAAAGRIQGLDPTQANRERDALRAEIMLRSGVAPLQGESARVMDFAADGFHLPASNALDLAAL